MGEIKDFKDLRVWEVGITLVKDIYRITGGFPKSEQFGLTNQMRRASVSIPSNIAEGHVRNMTKEFCRYLNISLGSCAELETQLIIAKELGWLKTEDFDRLSETIKAETRQINALKKRLSESRIPNPES
jgi:four helix bundle protein